MVDLLKRLIMISQELLDYLKDLEKYNNREWFNKNKATYLEHFGTVKAFFKSVESKLQNQDLIEGHKIMRIYRDIRFSKDKTPFKPRFAGNFKRATAALRGGYFLNIQPGRSIVGGGFYAPNTEDLKRIRQELEMDPHSLQKIINEPHFKKTYGELLGEGVKTAPRGFDPNSEAIELIRKKQFYFVHNFTDKEVISSDFEDKIVSTYKAILPFFDYMSEVLTTDLNGESILGQSK